MAWGLRDSSESRMPESRLLSFCFAEDADHQLCEALLAYFKLILIIESDVDLYGLNAEKILSVRSNDIERGWENISDTEQILATSWARKTPLGDGARYIIINYDRLA